MTRRAAALNQKRAAASTDAYATPLVRKLAERHSVALASVTGTGVSGRITAGDVRRAAGITEAARRLGAGRVVALSAAGISRPQLQVRMPSQFSPPGGAQITVDVFSPNPLVEDLRATDPDRYGRRVAAAGQPPTLFQTGDLPTLTASGQPTSLLMQLPAVARHAGATADGPSLAGMLEAYGFADPRAWEAANMAHCLDVGLLLYEARFRAWADESGFVDQSAGYSAGGNYQGWA